MTVDQFEDFLNEVVQNVEQLDNNLVPLINQMVQELKNRAPVDNGDLKSSIRATVVDNAVTFSFLDYGLYQNFGVAGTKQNQGAKPISQGLQGAGKIMKFGSQTIGGKLPFGVRKAIAEKGLKPQDWFDFEDMQQRIITEIERLTTQNNQ